MIPNFMYKNFYNTLPIKNNYNRNNLGSYLVGLIEGNGNFYLNWKYSEKSQCDNIILAIYYLRLSQKQIYNRKIDPYLKKSNFDIMFIISEFLKIYVISSNRKRINYEKNASLIKTDKIESKNAIFASLKGYPMFGYKYFSHLNLNLGMIHNLIIKSEYKIQICKSKFYRICKFNEI